MIGLSSDTINEVVGRALREDVGAGDLTSMGLIPAEAQFRAQFVLREAGVVAGLPVAQAVFATLDKQLVFKSYILEGEQVAPRTTIASVEGSARSILTGERVALNLLQRMSGIATLTARYVEAIQGTKARILDTRKTTPGLRALEKYAVRVGGGVNHRFGLYDGVMLKDNHLALLAQAGISLHEAVQQARASVGPMVRVEIEVETVAQAIEAVEAGAEMLLLDNMAPEELQAAVAAVGGKAILEASGGITLETIRAVAETGVDYISVGALTHSVRALDIGLDVG
jgi:nicotinate-nucleotide pyrophosphorylase (carboxylating)